MPTFRKSLAAVCVTSKYHLLLLGMPIVADEDFHAFEVEEASKLPFDNVIPEFVLSGFKVA
jgi:hypothetical protein